MNNPLLFFSALFFGSSLILGCISIGFSSTLQRLYFAFLCWGVIVSLMNHGLKSKFARIVDRMTMICGIIINLVYFVFTILCYIVIFKILEDLIISLILKFDLFLKKLIFN
jgi:hypothetical protein